MEDSLTGAGGEGESAKTRPMGAPMTAMSPMTRVAIKVLLRSVGSGRGWVEVVVRVRRGFMMEYRQDRVWQALT